MSVHDERPIDAGACCAQERQLEEAAKNNEEAQAVIDQLRSALHQLELRFKQVCRSYGIPSCSVGPALRVSLPPTPICIPQSSLRWMLLPREIYSPDNQLFFLLLLSQIRTDVRRNARTVTRSVANDWKELLCGRFRLKQELATRDRASRALLANTRQHQTGSKSLVSMATAHNQNRK